MMAVVKQWLLGITGAAILTALAEVVMPEGGVKQVGKLVCGLVLLVAVLQPLCQWGETELVWLSGSVEEELQKQTQQLQKEVDAQMRSVIEEELAAYSMDKAAQLGIACQVRVTCACHEDGIFLPEELKIWGVAPEQEPELARVLGEELGLVSEKILFQEGEMP